MRLAVGQAPASSAIDKNVTAAVHLIGEASTAGARLLLLSELFLTGYDLDRLSSDPEGIDPSDPRLDPLRSACEAGNVSALIGAATPGPDGVLDNSLLWFGSDGSAVIIYRKVHLWEGERAIFTPGARGVLVPFEGLTIGLGICYDAAFPEFSRAYAAAGVDLILYASAFAYGTERSRYHIYHPARALESGSFLAVSNAFGPLGAGEFFGESAIYDPYGIRLADAGSTPGIVTADIVASTTTRARESLTYLTDRLTDYTPSEIRN